MAQGEVIIDVDVRTGEAEKSIEEVNKQVSDVAKQIDNELSNIADVSININTEQATESVETLKTAVSSLSEQSQEVEIKTNVEGIVQAEAQLRKLTAQYESLAAATYEFEFGGEPEKLQQAIDKYQQLYNINESLAPAVGQLTDNFQNLGNSIDPSDIEKYNLAVDSFIESMLSLNGNIQDAKSSFSGIAESNQTASKSFINLEERINDTIKTLTDFRGFTLYNKQAGETTKVIDDLIETFKTLNDVPRNIVITSDTKSIQEAEKELQNLQKSYDKVIDAIEAAKENIRDTGGAGEGGEYFYAIIRGSNEAAERISALETAIKSAKDELADTQAQEQFADAQKKSAAETKKLEQEQKRQEKQTQLLQAAMIRYLSQGINQVLSGINSLVESTAAYRQEIGMLEANLQSAGINLDEASQYMGRFGSVSSDTSANVAAVSSLLQTGFSGNELEQAIDAVSGAVIAFPNQNIQQIGADIQRTFSRGEAVRTFADLIRNTGGDVNLFNSQMAAASTEAQKQDIILQELSRQGLTEVLEAYKELHPELVEASESQSRLNEAMAELGEAFQPAYNMIMEVKAALAEFGVTVLDNVPGLAEFVVVVAELGKVFITVAAGITIVSKIIGGLPQIFGTAGTAATVLGNGAAKAGSAAAGAANGFLTFGAGVALIGVGIGAAILAINELAKTFSESSKSPVELAVAIGIVVAAIAAAIAIISAVAKASSAAIPDLTAFAVVFAAIALSASVLIDSLKELIQVIREIPPININGNISSPSTGGGGPRSFAPAGYAHGTASARRGYNWVDETTSPRLLWFNGGETVLTGAQSMAQRSALSNTNRSITNVYNLGGMSINANTIKSLQDIFNIMENEANSYKQGYVEVY